METIEVNGKTYYSEKPNGIEFQGDYKIVVLQRGWIVIGKMEREGSQCKLHSASVIRNWGTEKGLGELAEVGPKKDTILDPCNGAVEFDYLTVILTIAVNEDKWKKHL
jgi:hypothetical protein